MQGQLVKNSKTVKTFLKNLIKASKQFTLE